MVFKMRLLKYVTILSICGFITSCDDNPPYKNCNKLNGINYSYNSIYLCKNLDSTYSIYEIKDKRCTRYDPVPISNYYEKIELQCGNVYTHVSDEIFEKLKSLNILPPNDKIYRGSK